MIGGAVGGGIMGLMSAKAYTMGGLGIFGVVNYINNETGDASSMIAAFLCILAASVVGFVLTFFFWKDDTVEESDLNREEQKVLNKEIVSTPIAGTVAPLSTAKDDAFAQGILGKGILIHPEEGKVVAPFDGTVMTLFPTKHAIGLVSDNGLELLIHIGLDTVQLEGKFFESFVKQGDHVTRGQTLVTFDIAAIEKAGYSVETPVIVTNVNDYLDIVEVQNKQVAANDDLITALI